MLDVMRRHASSWAIKAIIAAIVISFAFFFGYNAVRRASKQGLKFSPGDNVATVNGSVVPAAEFLYFYDVSMDNLKQSFKDKDIPPFLAEMAKKNVLQMVVSRGLALSEAEKLGLVVPDRELADTIKSIQTSVQGGQFDPLVYRQRYLPYFKSRFGMDYENFVRRDLLIDSFRKMFSSVGLNTSGTSSDEEETWNWNFEVVKLEPAKLIADKAMGDKSEALALAEELTKTPADKWKSKLKPFKVEPRSTGPIGISARRSIDPDLTVDELTQVFGLSKESPVTQKPFEHVDKILVIRLVDKTKPEKKADASSSDIEFFNEWISRLLAKADIKTSINLEGEEQK